MYMLTKPKITVPVPTSQCNAYQNGLNGCPLSGLKRPMMGIAQVVMNKLNPSLSWVYLNSLPKLAKAKDPPKIPRMTATIWMAKWE